MTEDIEAQLNIVKIIFVIAFFIASIITYKMMKWLKKKKMIKDS